jgi:hypothetical protein
MFTFRLCWKDHDLGGVEDLSGDYPAVWATFRPGPGLDEAFRELFSFLVDEERCAEDPPFAADLLDEENWWLVDGRGKRWGITLPAVHLDDHTISWRWRGPDFPRRGRRG